MDEDLLLRRRVKAELRKRMRALRATVPASVRGEKSFQIVERLLRMPLVAEARTVALFWPIEERNEVDLRPLHARLRARGALVTYPAMDTETGALTFRFVDDASSMRPNGLGVPEPPPEALEAAPGEIDVIVVPALAVDPRGHRIGYGAGYYDRFLLRVVPPASSVCVAFDFQLLVDLPNTPEDVPVTWIATDARTMGPLG